MYKLTGGCHCGNIWYFAEISKAPSAYKPWVCDCKFCTSHGAEYLSDKDGSLNFTIKNKAEISRYKQGSQIAEFLVCKVCGVLVGALYEDGAFVFGSLNVRPLKSIHEFSRVEKISPEKLNDVQRIDLWKRFWFRDVKINYEIA